MNEELKQFNIDLDSINESNELFDNIQEAIEKLKVYSLKDKFEVVLNNNLIECKEKLTNYRTILGCRVSYDNLPREISFIVREDDKPSYEDLEQEIERLNNDIKILLKENGNKEKVIIVQDNIIKEVREYIEENMFKDNNDCGCWWYGFDEYREAKKELLEILDKVDKEKK